MTTDAVIARISAATRSRGDDGSNFGWPGSPAIEYESVLQRGGDDVQPAYRVFDDHGNVLALRSDMTVPIARVVATRYATADPPLRFSYFAHAYRGVRPQRGQPREFLQAGVELVGSPSPEGTIEALNVLCAALDAVGLEGYRVGLGDASLFPTLLDELGVAGEPRARILHELYSQDFAGLEREVARLDIEPDAAGLLVRVPQVRGESAVLDDFAGGVADAALASVRAVLEGVDAKARRRVIVDLGLARALGYYTGAVFEVYDPALGVPLGGGGRYDDLLGRFGRGLPAVGFALNVERLHIALMGEEPR